MEIIEIEEKLKNGENEEINDVVHSPDSEVGTSKERIYWPLVPNIIRIKPAQRLEGNVVVPGDKVAGVHLILASAATDCETTIKNIHYCGDVLRLLNWMHVNKIAKIEQHIEFVKILPLKHRGIINLSKLSKTRSNICLVSAYTLKYGRVIFRGANGCNFTTRKIDKHLKLMKAFGLNVIEKEAFFEVTRVCKKDKVLFDCATKEHGPSVGVTCHALIASTNFPGKITLTNVALEAAPLLIVKFLRQSTNRHINIKGRTIDISATNKIK